MSFLLRILGFQGLKLPIYIGNVRGGSALFGGMPSLATSVAQGLRVIGLGPPLTSPTPKLSWNNRASLDLSWLTWCRSRTYRRG